MSSTTSLLLTVSVLALALGLSYRPFGDYLARVYTSNRHLRVERWMYRTIGVDPDADQRWTVYARCLVAFSLVSVLFLFLLQRIQQWLPSPRPARG